MSISTNTIDSYQLNSFIAQEELIEIIPKFQLEEFRGINGTYGPFRPNESAVVPLWLALMLRSSQVCAVVAPAYLSVAGVAALVEEDQASAVFTRLPSHHFFEVAALVLAHAPEGVEAPELVARLVAQLRRARLQRLHRTLRLLRSRLLLPGLQAANLAAAEVPTARATLAAALTTAHRIAAEAQGPRAATPAWPSPQSPPTGPRSSGQTDAASPDSATAASEGTEPLIRRRRTLRMR